MAILPSKAVVTILTVITAMVHFYLGINGGLSLDPSNGLNLLFVLNGLGYFYLVLAIFWAPDFLRGHSPYLRLFFYRIRLADDPALLYHQPGRSLQFFFGPIHEVHRNAFADRFMAVQNFI